MPTSTLRLAATLGAALAFSLSAHAQDLSAWQKDRDAKFAAFRAAHPNQDAEIADIKAKTAALIAAYVPPPTAEKYADLKARSAALTPDQQAQAQAMFKAAFKLWQSGDYASAKVGFSQGLAIDPANGPANFYVGDILQRQSDATGAGLYMDRAATLAAGTAEAFKASAALQNLPAPETSDLARAPVIWRVSDEPLELWDGADYPEMIVVPAGDFTMGSPAMELGRADDESSHRVRIGYSFAVSKYPITVGEFAQFVAETHYDAGDSCWLAGSVDNIFWNERSGRNWRNPGFPQTARSPSVCLNYNDAAAYAAWLSKKTGHSYRLLSEAEYEYSERAGSTTAYWWGNNVYAACAYANVFDLNAKARLGDWGTGVICGDGYIFTAPVGSFKANAFGLYDMMGNVQSWTSDCYKSYAGGPTDGSANSSSDCSRVLRGASWGGEPTSGTDGNRAARRHAGGTVGHRDDFTGFRLARTL